MILRLKDTKSGREILYLIEKRLSKNEVWCALCAADNHKSMITLCAKEFLDSKFNEAVID